MTSFGSLLLSGCDCMISLYLQVQCNIQYSNVMATFPARHKLLTEDRDNASVQTTAKVRHWLSEHTIQVLPQAPYSADLATVEFLIPNTVNGLLAGQMVKII
jgi:hypothetical protein